MADKIKEHEEYYEVPKNVFTENFVDLYKANMKLTIENKKLKERVKVLNLKDTPHRAKDIDYYDNKNWACGRCPSCRNLITTSMEYCDRCGQHILWDEKGKKDD